MPAFETIVFLMLTTVLLSLAAWAAGQLTPAGEITNFWLEEWPWFAKGFGTPALLWTVINFGVGFQLPPFFPYIQNAQLKGLPWFAHYLAIVTGGFVMIASIWTAVTLVSRLLPAYREMVDEARLEFHAVCFTSFAIMVLPALGLLIFVGWGSLGFAVLLLAVPIIHYGGPVLMRPKPKPMYSRALARLKRGRYSDAETEILSQLEKAENDFDGWMLLAQLHAVHFGELGEAEKIILDVCLDPNTNPSQIAVALHKLADWQIQLAGNPEAASRTLKLISDRLPGTHLAHMAELRRAQLPTNQQLQEEKQGRPIAVPHVPTMFEFTEPPPALTADLNEAVGRVEQLTQALTRDPNHVTSRETLARLLASPIGQFETAIEQLRLLLGMEAQPAGKRLQWLTWIASWQITDLHDDAAAVATLTEIVEDFPNSPEAFAAKGRLNLISPDASSRRT